MAGLDKLDGDAFLAFASRALTAEGKRLTPRAGTPLIGGAIGLAMGEERIHHHAEFFALTRHDIHRVMQKRAADLRRRLGHEDARGRLASHQHGQRTHMIEVSVGENDRVELAIAERAEVRERFLPLLFRMHPGVDNEPLSSSFEIITIRTDLRAPREIDELHGNDE